MRANVPPLGHPLPGPPDTKKEIEMLPESSAKNYQERLTELWNEGSKDIALAFLRRALSHTMSLDELAHALQFAEVRNHLAEIQLDDVLPALAQSAPPRSLHQAAAAPAAEPFVAEKSRRRRRSSQEISELRDALMGRLQAAVGSVTTSHLRDVLSNGGHDVDLLQLGRMLAALEQEGYITCLGGKPKAWRLKPQGRRAPEPLVIRKAQPAAAQDDSAAG